MGIETNLRAIRIFEEYNWQLATGISDEITQVRVQPVEAIVDCAEST